MVVVYVRSKRVRRKGVISESSRFLTPLLTRSQQVHADDFKGPRSWLRFYVRLGHISQSMSYRIYVFTGADIVSHELDSTRTTRDMTYYAGTLCSLFGEACKERGFAVNCKRLLLHL